MYATNYTYVIIRAVYQMLHTEPLTVEPQTRPVESTLEGDNCIAVFVMKQVEDRWMLPVGFKLLGVKVVVRDALRRCNAGCYRLHQKVGSSWRAVHNRAAAAAAGAFPKTSFKHR